MSGARSPWPPRADTGLPRVEGYLVDRVPGFRAGKPYHCPACEQTIGVGVGHVVAWPEDAVELRRHWHLHCWRIAARRGRL